MHAIGSTTGQRSTPWSMCAATDLRSGSGLSGVLLPEELKNDLLKCYLERTLDLMDGMLSMDSTMAFVRYQRVESLRDRWFCLVCVTPHLACGFSLRSLTGSGLECPARARPMHNPYFHKSKVDHGWSPQSREEKWMRQPAVTAAQKRQHHQRLCNSPASMVWHSFATVISSQQLVPV